MGETKKCIDTDGGKKFKKQGICKDQDNPEGRQDGCTGNDDLIEYYCDFDRCRIQIETCDDPCYKGACL